MEGARAEGDGVLSAARVVAALLLAASPAAQVPPDACWIWSAPAAADGRAATDRAWLLAEIDIARTPAAAELFLAADNHARAFLDGRRVLASDDWAAAARADVTTRLLPGRHLLAIEAHDDGGPAAVIAWLRADGAPVWRSDAAVRAFDAEPPGWPAPAPDAPGAHAAAVLGPHGSLPWGTLAVAAPPALFPADGLQVEEVASGFGSLIALALDDAGAPIVSVESGGLLRLHDDDGDGRFERAAPFCDELRACQGLCFTGAEAWATGVGPQGPGFYRLPAPAAGADTPRAPELVARITGSIGEHGPHAVRPGPDGRLLVMLGNHVGLDAPLAPDSPLLPAFEGHVVPRLVDPGGHATDIRAPGGQLHSFDPADGAWRTLAAGFRNAYDVALAPNGDIFTFDSDMEWDIGLPWYRAVRVVHCLPGGDYGWRTGSAKWPDWYPDSLPPVLETGRGSPTGVAWCGSPAFPPAFRDTLLLGDWAQGRVLSVRLDADPDGVSYRGRAQVLLSGRPLPVTDLEPSRDGSLLLTLGGRGARGALLRVTGDGSAAGEAQGFTPAGRAERLDASTPLAELETLLGHPDRALRYLAARELERRPTRDVDALLERAAPGRPGAGWSDPALVAELLVVRARQALLAGDEAVRTRRADAALFLLAGGQPPAARRVAARALELLLLAGEPDALEGRGQPPDPALGAALLPLFPSGDPALDRELALLLARTEPPGARAALLDALDGQPAAEEALHLLYALSALRDGAAPGESRRALVRLATLRARPGGASYQGYLDALERRLLALAPEAEREALRALAPVSPSAAVLLERGAPPRDRERTLAFVREALDAPERSAAEGAGAFARLCAACHRRGESAGAGGPDLTSIGARLALPDLLVAVMEPSRDVSDQYRSTRLRLLDGREPEGLVLRDDGAHLTLLTRTGETLDLAAADVAERTLSTLSAMPEGLLDGLSLRAVADLCAFLLDPAAPAAPPLPAWEPLFAQDLGGWRPEAGAWAVERGALRAAADAGPARLVAPFEAGELAFEAELLLPAGRARVLLAGVAVELGGSPFCALQELAPAGRRVEADRLLLDPLLVRAGWNHVLVEARAGRVRVAVNGLQAAALELSPPAAGPLALEADDGTGLALRLAALRRP